ncbi:MAG: DNA alkylation repair protein [Gammaproteobacteria bacterium]|nr:DNA alkylation repair protein [Gammaproteobacteria bacterium]
MKDLFNTALIELTAKHIKKHYSDFDQHTFIAIASDSLEQRELKDRANQIFRGLFETLPQQFEQAIDILLRTLAPVEENVDLTDLTSNEQGLLGWIILPYSQYVGELGARPENKVHLLLALDALKQMTQRFSSEFGIRYLLLAYPEQTLQVMSDWCQHSCHHVRRLVSEGTRPLLPWAMQLPNFKNDPKLAMSHLQALRDDESEYVRRSVANHLNDVAKHHPDFVANIADKWLQEKPADINRQRMLKHACRTLLKQGHPATLATFGYFPPTELNVQLTLNKQTVELGMPFEMQLEITNNSDTTNTLLVDYVIYHQKANGKLTPKVFKWKTLKIAGKEKVAIVKKHHIKPITTRKYYPGKHQCAIQINGQILQSVDFTLTV